MTFTNQSAAIDIPTDDVTTMTATNNAGKAITGTDMNEIIPQSMTDEGMIGGMGTRTSNEIRSEDIFAGKSAERKLEITMPGRHRKTGKWKKPAG